MATLPTAPGKKKPPAKRIPAPPKRTPAQVKASTRRGDRIIQFIERYIIVPEGALVGKPMVLLPQQKHFISDVYDNVDASGKLVTRRGILSIARKNGKSGLISALLGAHILGPEAKPNSQLYSAARSREQASVVFNYLAKSIRASKKLEGLVQITDSGRKIVGLATNSMYKALSADATTAHGLSPALTIHDELGQVVGPTDALYDALETAGGAQEEPLSLIISTQAANDADLFSKLIDDGLMYADKDPRTRVHLHAATREEDIFDPKVWYRVNYALGIFRKYDEFQEMAERAQRMPSSEATFRNLYLNMRIAMQSLLVPPTLWKENNTQPDEELFRSGLPVRVALDLSARVDLSAAVCTVQDPDTGIVHVKVFAYTPLDGLEERAKVDRAPYPLWVDQEWLTATAGCVVGYDQVCEHLKSKTEEWNIASVHFDPWRMEIFKKEAERAGWACEETIPWIKVSQDFKHMSPCIESFETILLNRMLAHGSNPVLDLGAANAIVVRNPAGERRTEKSRSTGRIDALVAAVMSVHACVSPPGAEPEVIHTDEDFAIL